MNHLAFVFQLSEGLERALKEGGMKLKAEAYADGTFV